MSPRFAPLVLRRPLASLPSYSRFTHPAAPRTRLFGEHTGHHHTAVLLTQVGSGQSVAAYRRQWLFAALRFSAGRECQSCKTAASQEISETDIGSKSVPFWIHRKKDEVNVATLVSAL